MLLIGARSEPPGDRRAGRLSEVRTTQCERGLFPNHIGGTRRHAWVAGDGGPIILPLSNPTALAEAVPADLVRWTDGKALVATGSPFDPVTYNGVIYTIGQANNAMLFPGVVLGTIVTRARLISDGMFVAAAGSIADMVNSSQPGVPILPDVARVRDVSARVAVAVSEQAIREGLARRKPPNLAAAIREAMWEPRYRPIKAV